MTRPSRSRAGTLAVAGTIPVNDVGTKVIPGSSQGHHPAEDRPAVPTRGYESGSDGSSRHPPRYATPARPARPRPEQPARNPTPGLDAAMGERRRARLGRGSWDGIPVPAALLLRLTCPGNYIGQCNWTLHHLDPPQPCLRLPG